MDKKTDVSGVAIEDCYNALIEQYVESHARQMTRAGKELAHRRYQMDMSFDPAKMEHYQIFQIGIYEHTKNFKRN